MIQSYRLNAWVLSHFWFVVESFFFPSWNSMKRTVVFHFCYGIHFKVKMKSHNVSFRDCMIQWKNSSVSASVGNLLQMLMVETVMRSIFDENQTQNRHKSGQISSNQAIKQAFIFRQMNCPRKVLICTRNLKPNRKAPFSHSLHC